MTRIESEVREVAKSASEVYAFLSDFRNFSSIMPEQVTDWQATADNCSFTIKGMASLGMKIIERKENELISIVRDGKAPFDFKLHCIIGHGRDSNSTLQLAFDAELNPMLKMMAEKPLKNFLDLLVSRYSQMT